MNYIDIKSILLLFLYTFYKIYILEFVICLYAYIDNFIKYIKIIL